MAVANSGTLPVPLLSPGQNARTNEINGFTAQRRLDTRSFWSANFSLNQLKSHDTADLRCAVVVSFSARSPGPGARLAGPVPREPDTSSPTSGASARVEAGFTATIGPAVLATSANCPGTGANRPVPDVRPRATNRRPDHGDAGAAAPAAAEWSEGRATFEYGSGAGCRACWEGALARPSTSKPRSPATVSIGMRRPGSPVSGTGARRWPGSAKTHRRMPTRRRRCCV